MEFMVEFDVHVPEGTATSEVDDRERAEASAAARLAEAGRLVRLWKLPGDGARAIGVYRADTEAQLDGWLGALPLSEWMHVLVTPLAPHPNDPSQGRAPDPSDAGTGSTGGQLPNPALSLVYRLEATLGQPLELGDTAQGRRRIVPLTGGTFTGPELNGTLVPGASADWQTILPDGTALGDIRYVLRTNGGDLLDVRSRSVRHGSPEVLGRLGRGEDVAPSEYTFRTSTQIQTGAPELDWLNKGVFIAVAGRQPSGVIYETYVVA